MSLVYVVDGHPLMRDALSMVLRRMGGACTAVEVDRMAAVRKTLAEQGAPVLAIMELKLPDANGVSGVREMRQIIGDDVPIVVYSSMASDDYEVLAKEAGATAYMEKTAAPGKLMQLLRTFIQPSPEEADNQVKIPEKLSKRQKQLLAMLDRGLSNKDIADQLKISEHTVKVHLWRLFRRMNVKSRSQASHLARSAGLLDF